MASSAPPHRRIPLVLLFALVSAAGAFPGAASAQPRTWIGGGPPGGNLFTVATDPSHAGTLYAGTQRGVFKTVGCPLVLSESPVEITSSPLLGEHTADILRDAIGCDGAELERLRAEGVI